MRSILSFALKVAISGGALFIVSRSVDWRDVGSVLGQAQPSWIVLALIIFVVAQVFSSLRLVYVANVLGGNLGLLTSLRAHFVGLWFNQVLPTSLGGDVVKVAMLKEPLGLSIALRSTILDRLFGFIFLIMAIAFTLPLYAKVFIQQPNLTYALATLSIGGILAIILCAWSAQRILTFSLLHPILSKLVHFFSDIWTFRNKSFLWKQIWTSAIVHFNGIISYALIGLALGIDVNFVTFLLIVPVVFLFALLPISFAGWGVREAAVIWLFGMVGVTNESALAISLSFGMFLIMVGLPGLFLTLIHRTPSSKVSCPKHGVLSRSRTK